MSLKAHHPKKANISVASIAGLLIVLAAVVHKVRPDDIDLPRSDCNIDSLLQSLLMPDQYYAPSLQVQALRQDLLRLINAKQNEEDEMSEDDSLLLAESQYDPDKRSLASLARSGLIPKRNIGSFMKSGLYRPINSDGKRSISILAKNGQLPTLQSPQDIEEEKRNLASLARSGMIQTYKRNMESMAKNGYIHGKRDEDKRILASLARSGYLDAADKRYVGSLVRSGNYPFLKRNLASIVRDGYYGFGQNPYYNDADKRNVQSLMKNGLPTSSSYIGYDGKRNIGTLARDWSLPNHSGVLNQEKDTQSQSYVDKRNLASIRAQQSVGGNIRSKRSIFRANTDEYPLPVIQNSNGLDYENLLAELEEEYEPENKRFLGSVARSGWFRAPSSYRPNTIGKRHIGSLARLGWLPSFRYARSRFSRSGRSSPNRSYIDDTEGGEADTILTDLPQTPILADEEQGTGGRGVISYSYQPDSDTSFNDDSYFPENSDSFNDEYLQGLLDRIRIHNDLLSRLSFPSRYDNDAKASIADKRYLVLPALDNILLRKYYPKIAQNNRT